MIVNIGTISAGYGVISTVHPTGHTGIDFAVPMKTAIYAPCDGIVSSIRDYGNSSLGKAVFIQKADGTQYVLGHLSKIKVKVGQVIHYGDLLCYSGNSGRSTGPHVHYGEFLANGVPIDPGNITFTAFQHHPITDWMANVAIGWIVDVITSIISNPQFLTLAIVLFSLWFMVSSLRIGKWIVLGAFVYTITIM